MNQKVAFIGLGAMGYPMAGHLARAGHAVTVYNRTAAKASAWCQDYGVASHATTPAQAAQDAAVVFCCVGNDFDVRQVFLGEQGALSCMQAGSVFVDHSTVSADLARELAAVAHQQGVAFIDAPVSGGQVGAQKGTLSVMCGGAAPAFEKVQPLIMAYARACHRMGDSGAGQLTKMVNQICIAGLLQSLSEALAFGSRAGLDMTQVLEVISQGAAQSWQMQNRGPTMLAGEFDFGFAVEWMRKDLGLVLSEARRNGAQLPVAALVDQFYADVENAGGKRWDTSSLITRL